MKIKCDTTIFGWDMKQRRNIEKMSLLGFTTPLEGSGQAMNKIKEFTTDAPELQAKGAIKYDGGKTPIYQGIIDYFPRAIEAVAQISAFGASKYAWKGWEGVEDGYNRYSNAMHRHELYKATQGLRDIDSGLLHDAHFAWGALARLEIWLRENEKNQTSN